MKYVAACILTFLSVLALKAQHPNKLMREGLAEYKSGNYPAALEKYNQAMGKNADKSLAHYNMGTAYYKAGKPDSALMHWQTVATGQQDQALQAKAWHNIGNSFVKQRNFEKAVDAYKRALKLNPDDEDTRYNLAYSQRQMQSQQNQNQNQNQKQEKQDQKPEQKPEDKQDDEKLNKELADRMLKALDNKEKELHGRKKEKGDGTPSKPEKDW